MNNFLMFKIATPVYDDKGDSSWFDENPDRTFRVRRPTISEKKLIRRPDQGCYALIHRLSEGVHVRSFFNDNPNCINPLSLENDRNIFSLLNHSFYDAQVQVISATLTP